MSLLNRRFMRLMPCLHPLMLLLLFYFAMRALYFGHVPMLDSRGYYDLILYSHEQPFDIINYAVGDPKAFFNLYGGHNSVLWTFLFGLPNYLYPRSFYAYNVWVAILGVTSVAAFYGIVTELSAPVLSVGERLLVTALFAFHPSAFASQVNVTIDTGLIIFWTWYLLALLKEKTLLATVAGCFLAFTKEPALAHMLILFVFCAWRQPEGTRRQWVWRHAVAVWLPWVLMALFLLYKVLRHQNLFFRGVLQWHDPDHMLRVLPDHSLVIYLLMAFVLNFNWVLTSLGVGLSILFFQRGPGDRKQDLAMVWLLVATTGVILGVRHVSNVRYFLPLLAVMILYFAHVLPTIRSRNRRAATLAVLLVALGWQNVRSVDPVSNIAFCTVPVGKHNLLAIPYLDNVCSWGVRSPMMPRDELMYNLEFTHLPLLFDAAMQDIRPDNHTALVEHWLYYMDWTYSLDKNYRPTYSDVKVTPKMMSMPDPITLYYPSFINSLPDKIYYIEVPMIFNSYYREFFLGLYADAQEKTYDIDGYQLTVIRLWHKNRGAWCELP